MISLVCFNTACTVFMSPHIQGCGRLQAYAAYGLRVIVLRHGSPSPFSSEF